MTGTALRTSIGIALCAGLLGACSWSAQAPSLTIDARSAPPGITVQPTAEGAPIASNGPLSDGLLACTVDGPSSLVVQGEPEVPLNTPIADIDLRRPVSDAVLCVVFSDRGDGTNRGIERGRVPLGDLTQLRELAFQQAARAAALPPDTPVILVGCVFRPYADSVLGRYVVMQAGDSLEVLRVDVPCEGVNAPGVRYSPDPLDASVDRVIQGSVPSVYDDARTS
jgi:hypothetical protein